MARIGVCVKNLTSGGAEKQAVLLANVLASIHDVNFIIVNGAKVHEKYIEMLSPSVRITKFEGDRNDRFTQYKSHVRAENYDILFPFLTAANFYSVRACLGTSTKVVTGLRNSRLPLFKHVVDAILNRFCAPVSVCNCYSGKKFFSKTGFKNSKISVIQNCFDNIEDYSDHPHRETVKIITVGRFVAQKDYRTAIRAVAEVYRKNGNIKFTVIGYGELESRLKKWIKDEGIEDVTEILINPDNIYQQLRDSDIYLSTSLFEGISNSIMEGMNADLPIVATSVGDNDILVRHGENGFLAKKRDYLTLGSYLEQLVTDEQLRKLMGRKSKRCLVDNFNKDIFLGRYDGLITKLMQK